MGFDAEERPERGTYIHCIAMSMSNYVNRATMEFGGGERPDRRHVNYMTLSLSKYVNRATMEFDEGERPER